MDAGFIIRALELYALFLAFVLILDWKLDGKMYFIKIDEAYGPELDADFKSMINKIKKIGNRSMALRIHNNNF